MTGRLAGKVAIITGTGRGMGRQAAQRFAEEGAIVVGCDVDAEAADETLEILRDQNLTFDCMRPLDLSDESQVISLMKYVADTYGHIDVLYNNAMGQRMGNPSAMTLEAFNYTITNTLTIGWLCSKHAAPYMQASEGGSILFMGSIAGLPHGTGFVGNVPSFFSYSVAKAGVIRLAALLAVDLAPGNIRVNCISPSIVSSREDGLLPRIPGVFEAWEQRSLMRRVGLTSDVVNAAVYLCSDEAGFVTGHNLILDGGYLASFGEGVQDSDLREQCDAVLGKWYRHDVLQKTC
jgi:meso-butanediol dehydrogenase / (S,S)-butanediol dehydrogenase / diacetyl reductase